MKLNEKIKLALDEAHLSVAEMAGHLEMHRNSVNRYVTGETDPPIKTLERIAERTSKPIWWFFMPEGYTAVSRERLDELTTEMPPRAATILISTDGEESSRQILTTKNRIEIVLLDD